MKLKIAIVGLVLMGSVFASFGQTPVYSLRKNSGVAVTSTNDSVVNTGIDTLNYSLSGSYTNVAIQAVVTKSTGDPSGNLVLLYGSLDGTNFSQISTDTFKVANVATAQSHIWRLNSANTASPTFDCQFLKLIHIGAGTQKTFWLAKIRPMNVYRSQ